MKSNQLITRDSQPEPRLVTYDALVLDAGLRQSLMTVRSLGSRGLRVAALETFADAPTFEMAFDRFVKGAQQTKPGLPPDLVRILARRHGTALDEMLEHVKTLADLGRHFGGHLYEVEEQTQGIAQKLGIGVPRGVKVKAVGGVEAALHEVGLPAVVKPVESWDEQHRASMKSELVTTPDEARRAVEKLTRFGGTTLFQQFLPGERESMGLVYANGQVYARFVQWTKRSVPPLGGTSVVHRSIAVPPDIGTQAERLVREIGLEGYSQLEFRRGNSFTSLRACLIIPPMNASIRSTQTGPLVRPRI